jgi:hypothetical protein
MPDLFNRQISSVLKEKVSSVDQDLASIILGSCIRAAREIGDLAHVVPKERTDLKQGIAEIVHEIHSSLVEKITNEFPDLKVDMERKLAKYGRLV